MTRLLSRLPQTKDLSIGILLFVVVLLMILPMPTLLVDALIGLNFGIAILLLMTAIYISTPLSLSSLPGIILISTIFRLALSITTTRLILAEADAGAIVETFGSVVVAGNVVVGMVVFFIITVVQFIVIAKGAERIAEVGARFTLDALPGKQMSIDAELRNGDIDNVEAGRRRKLLERESQFYGAMDGAMKFVKGDAIAGLIIIFVNLIGGLIIGIVQFGMPLDVAARTYSLLTVGDALISQIPALLMAITAAVIVTRVKGEEQRNLGSDIITQIVSDERALRLAGVALIFMGLLPGFPTATLGVLGLGFLSASFLGLLRSRKATEKVAGADIPAGEAPAGEADIALPMDAPVVVEMAPGLFEEFEPAKLSRRAQRLASNVAEHTGLDPYGVSVVPNPSLEPQHFRLVIEGSPVLWSKTDAELLVLPDVAKVLDAHDIPYKPVATALWTRRLEVSRAHEAAIAGLGLRALSPHDVIFTQAEEGLLRNIAVLIGLQETREILTQMEARYPVLVSEVLRVLPVQRISEVFKRLLEEQIPLSNKRKILEALVEWAPVDTNALALTEYTRIALKQQICEAVSDARRTITVIVIERDTEDILRSTLRDTNIGTFMVLNEQQTSELLSVVRTQAEALAPKGVKPVMITSLDVRRHLKTFLTRNSIEIEVMSFQELSDDYTVVPCSTLTLKSAKSSFRKKPAASQETPEEDTPPPATN